MLGLKPPLNNMSSKKYVQRQSKDCRFIPQKNKASLFKIHPLFFLVGIWYACTGELFLFLLSALVAIQHECAHAFAAAKLGYRLNKIVLMPFGAIIDGDLRGIGVKEEIYVAVWGPLCNLFTAVFFVAVWWFEPTMYAFTDTACYSSLVIALVNLLPAYPLDGGRILRCILVDTFLRKHPDEGIAERKAEKICRLLTLLFSFGFLSLFIVSCTKTVNVSLLLFALFLAVGAFGNREKNAVYGKMDFFRKDALKRGAEIRHVAVLESCTVKQALRFLSKDAYLLLEVYNEQENYLFCLSQNDFAVLFANSSSPHETLGALYQKNSKKTA